MKSTQFKSQIPQADWEKVQRVLSSKDKQKEIRGKESYNAYRSPLAKLLTCHFCGCQITTDRKVKKNKTYVYLRCTNGKKNKEPNYYINKFGKSNCIQPYNSENEVMGAIDEQIFSLWMDETIMVWLKEELQLLKSKEDLILQKKPTL